MNAASRISPARALWPAAIALLLLCVLQLACLLRAPAAWMPAQVSVALAGGASTAIEAQALGLPQGESGRLRLRRDAQGAWWAANDGLSRPLILQRGEIRHASGSVALAEGMRFQLGSAVFAVENAGVAGARLLRGQAHWDYDGATVRRNGAVLPACPDTRIAGRLASAWNRLTPAALAIPRPLVFGGNLDCGNRIAIPGQPAPAARLARTREGLLLTSAFAPLLLDAGTPVLLAQREEALADIGSLSAGRTRFLVQQNGDLLQLQPLSHVALYNEAQLRLPDGVSWTWTRRQLWNLPPQALAPLAAVLLLALAAGAASLPGQRGQRGALSAALRLTGAALLAGSGLLLLYLQKTGNPAGSGLALLAAWAALWSILAASRGASPGAAGALLLALGLLAQLELGLGAFESSWLRHFNRTAALLAIGAGFYGLWQCLVPKAPPSQARVEAALLGLSALALLFLLLQVAFGDETGVFDLQPVEFAKLALAALCAHCLALAAGGDKPAGGGLRRALRLATPALLFLVLLAVALVQVDDYSPLVLLTVWGGAMALGYACTTGERLLAAGCLMAAIGAALGVVLLRGAGPEGLAQWNFYADRFQVWLDPGSHPHTGQQLLLGAKAIAGGGWWGADGWMGLASLGRDAGPVLRIPAVQDDFAPSFFLNRHGLAAALVLWLLQALFLAGLVRTAVRCWLLARQARDWRQAWLARFRCYLLCGGAAFVFGHLLLSWGTNLAIFPVMGQPMSFLSAGGSHLLFFIFPLLAFGVASCQSLEENESCRA